MKPFKLEVVLKHRKRLEEMAQGNLAASLKKENELRAMLADCEANLARTCDEMAAMQQRGVDLLDLQLHIDHVSHLHRRIEALGRQVAKAEQETGKRRDELAQASRDRQLLEKLKDKKNMEYRYHMQRKDAALMDEIAIRSFREESDAE